jgi:predicted phosphodiesterase
MRIAVLGDIHANVRALKAAFERADRKGFDKLILLGDLLTYGADIVEVIDLVGDRFAAGNLLLLKGNHDAMYLDLLSNQNAYFTPMPAWIRESVEWTMRHLPHGAWKDLAFDDEFALGSFLFSHANPYGANRWDYLNTIDQNYAAAEKLLIRKFNVGVFGHTHRPKWYRNQNSRGEFLSVDSGILDLSSVHILNAGSIGQPRDKNKTLSTVLWIQVNDIQTLDSHFFFQPFSWDVAGHLQALSRTGMSESTLKKLAEFYIFE